MATIESAGGYVAEIRPYGPDDTELERFREKLEAGALAARLFGVRRRWLSFHVVPEVRKGHTNKVLDPPRLFTGTLYDYTNDRTIVVGGELDDPDGAVFDELATQPLPVYEEFREAVDLLRADSRWGPLLSSGEVRPYRPMPPLFEEPALDDASPRVVAVGLYALEPPEERSDAVAEHFGEQSHLTVGIDLSSQQVGPQQIPPEEECDCSGDCGAPIADDDCDTTGLTGQVEITVTAPDGSEIWRLLAIRPRATVAPPRLSPILDHLVDRLTHAPNDDLSVSTNGSGVELMDMFYRDRKVLHQAHVPILNVEYQGADPCCGCGPTFRDWLWQEACFEANGEDLMPGVRLCSERPRTMIEAGFDGGNFRGMAIFFDGNDLMLTSELQAGWYRYMTEWRLLSNGTVKPRFGFSAVHNPCTCQLHIHHAYYRLDFDIGETDNVVEEFNDDDPALGTGWSRLPLEISRFRNPDTDRYWRIGRLFGIDSTTEILEHYEIRPGSDDGTADLYGGSDVWLLRWDRNEIDDGEGFTSSRARSRERIDTFMDGESLLDDDLVVWYGVHYAHDQEELQEHDHVGEFVGPDLVCSWAEDIPDPTTTTSSTTSTTSSTTTSTTSTTTPGQGSGGGGGGSGGGGGGGGSDHGGGGGSGGGGGGST